MCQNNREHLTWNREGEREEYGETDESIDSLERHSGKHDILKQCWFSVGPASMTVAQH